MTELRLPGYKNLKVWQMGYELANCIYDATRKFPNGHFRLIDQMNGAAVSVYGNIAEGYCRNRLAGYLNSCEIARGELGELMAYLHQCEEKSLIVGEEVEHLNTLCNNLWPALGGLIIALQKKLKSGDWDRSLGSDPT
jgi:four helix bundle protein